MFYAVVIQMTEPAPVVIADAVSLGASSPSLAPSRNDKRERKHTAQSLPPGITHNMMKKFVVYYREFVNLKNGKRIPREYFKVESHPKLTQPWVTTKSVKVPLLEKLKDANDYVAKLETANTDSAATATTTTTTTATTTTATTATTTTATTGENGNKQFERLRVTLPKYTMLRVIRDTPTETILSLVYDRKDTLNGFRWTCSHTFSFQKYAADATAAVNAAPDASDVVCAALQELKTKLQEKYGIE